MLRSRKKTAHDLAIMTDLYREKCKELERAEIIIEILFKRLEER